jgi:hypothetical protein
MENKISEQKGSKRVFLSLCIACVFIGAAMAQTRLTAGPVQFDMIEIDGKFVSEGVGTADIDKDGDSDLYVGDYWYECPGKSYIGTWIKHEIRPPNKGGSMSLTDYSKCHGAFVGDFNGDGYPDPLIVPFHKEVPTWYENPKNKTSTRWVAHSLGYEYGVEQSWWGQLNPTGNKSLVTSNISDNSWGYWTPDDKGVFKETKVTGAKAPKTGEFQHGLGMADVNGDGRLDLIHELGWYENPGSTALWKYHADKFSDITNNEPSTLHTYDFNKDGNLDIFTASSHAPGIWWYNQTSPGKWKNTVISDNYNTNHSIVMEDIDLDGIPDFVSGKRYNAHDIPEDREPCSLYWVKVTPGTTPKFDIYVIKPGSAGIGTQFEVKDINGDKFPDIIVSSKTGTKIYLQVARAVSVTPALQTLRVNRHHGRLGLTTQGEIAIPGQLGITPFSINGRELTVKSILLNPTH